MMRFLRSLWMRLVMLSAILAIVPAIIYLQLQEADSERRDLLRNAVAEQGILIATAIADALDPARLPELQGVLERFDQSGNGIRVLFRPEGDSGGFFFVGAWPPISEEAFDGEKERLLATGALSILQNNCAWVGSTGSVYETVAGSRRAIASVTPVRKLSGCWVIVTTKAEVNRLGAADDVPYWQSPEMLVSAGIYLLMVLAVFGLFLSVRRNLRRFARLARATGQGGGRRTSFRQSNRLPELDDVAGSFDDMVGSLRRSADQLRTSAEENAHALKTPVGVIAQALEPLRRAIPEDRSGARSSIDRIDRAVERLDGLIGAIRKSEEAAAALISPAREKLDLADLVSRVVEGFREIAEETGTSLMLQRAGETDVLGNEELLTVAIENPLENALSLLSRGRRIVVDVRPSARRMVEVRISDNGPGIPEDRLEFIFLRHVSIREETGGDAGHDGLGLWLTRRNVEALGGTVTAELNRDDGLSIVLRLPAA
ncbi:MAG: HAMP domain-containing sensor histidine kinase [Minwuia sp.]|nr:HAMP domain-containing sensor histidine kinase [Minwuia sp.]